MSDVKWEMVHRQVYGDNSWETYYYNGLSYAKGGKLILVRTFTVSRDDYVRFTGDETVKEELQEMFMNCVVYDEETIVWNPIFAEDIAGAERKHNFLTKLIESGRIGCRDTIKTVTRRGKKVIEIETEWFDTEKSGETTNITKLEVSEE